MTCPEAALERLSARCLWALGRFDEAEKLLNSSAAAFTDSLIHTCTALSNMLGECGEAEKSEKAFDAVAMLSELSGDYDALGMLYQTGGQQLRGEARRRKKDALKAAAQNSSTDGKQE